MELIGHLQDAACVQHGLDNALKAFPFLLSGDFLDLSKYAGMDPMMLCTFVTTVFTLVCYFGSVLTGDYSFVDRLWSVSPVVFSFINAFASGWDTRCTVMFALTLVWGSRLTYNFARKGGYRIGDEDYRWPILRQRMSPFLFQVFNATFIAPYQNLLLMLIAIPSYVAFRARGTPLVVLDLVAIGLFVLFLTVETIADQQQWNFQALKHAKRKSGEAMTGDEKRGFLTHGLFRFSRHPNFFSEQCMWWSIYLFSVAASGVFINWYIAGAALLSLLFQGSTAFTEEITLGKYPEYAKYQLTTSRLTPWLPGPDLDTDKGGASQDERQLASLLSALFVATALSTLVYGYVN